MTIPVYIDSDLINKLGKVRVFLPIGIRIKNQSHKQYRFKDIHKLLLFIDQQTKNNFDEQNVNKFLNLYEATQNKKARFTDKFISEKYDENLQPGVDRII